eukprot:4072433-Prymnesium_polylepis.2
MADGGARGRRTVFCKQLELQAMCLQLHQVRVATSIVLALRGGSAATSTDCLQLRDVSATASIALTS